MHLVRTFKTVELFKFPLCQGICLRTDGRIEMLKKKKKRWDVRNQHGKLAHIIIKAVSLSSVNSSSNKTNLIHLHVAFGIIGKKVKDTFYIIIVKSHHSAMELNKTSSLLYGWHESKVTRNNDRGMASERFRLPV